MQSQHTLASDLYVEPKGIGSELGAHKRDFSELGQSRVTAVLKEAQLRVPYPADRSGRSPQVQ